VGESWLVVWLVVVGWLAGWLVGWLGGLVTWLVCLVGWLVAWLVLFGLRRLAGSLFGSRWLVGWLVGWLVWLLGWFGCVSQKRIPAQAVGSQCALVFCACGCRLHQMHHQMVHKLHMGSCFNPRATCAQSISAARFLQIRHAFVYVQLCYKCDAQVVLDG